MTRSLGTASSLIGVIFLLLIAPWQVTALGHYENASGQIVGQTLGSLISRDPWPMFRHDSSHIGFSPSTAPGTSEVAWRFSLFPGEIIWLMSPTVANGKVFIGTKGPPARLLALDEFSGRLLWSFDVPNGLLRASSVAAFDGAVFFGAWDNNVYALREMNGTLIWKFTADNWLSSSPTVANGTLFISSLGGFLYALDALTGQLRWRFQMSGEGVSSPAVADNMVFVGGGSNLYALDLAGHLLWNFTVPTPVIRSSPVVHEGLVYIGPEDGKIYGLDESSGAVLWKASTVPPTGGSELVSSPAVAYGRLYVCSWDDALYAVDLSNGALAWKVVNVCHVGMSPTVADGKVFAGGYDLTDSSITAGIVALNASTGSILWQVNGQYWVSSTVADGMVFTGGGEVIALGRPNLKEPFELDWADFENNGKVDIIDVAHAALAFDETHKYWDLNLNNITDVVDIATIALRFDGRFPNPEKYPGKGSPPGTMDPRWKEVCGLLPQPHQTYCITRV